MKKKAKNFDEDAIICDFRYILRGIFPKFNPKNWRIEVCRERGPTSCKY